MSQHGDSPENGGLGVRISGPSGLLPMRTEARMVERGLEHGWQPGQRDELFQVWCKLALDGNLPVRDRNAAARVLTALERNVIAADRNVIQEAGQELGAATDRLRATLGSPAALEALAALSAAVTQTPQPAIEATVAVQGIVADKASTAPEPADNLRMVGSDHGQGDGEGKADEGEPYH